MRIFSLLPDLVVLVGNSVAVALTETDLRTDLVAGAHDDAFKLPTDPTKESSAEKPTELLLCAKAPEVEAEITWPLVEVEAWREELPRAAADDWITVAADAILVSTDPTTLMQPVTERCTDGPLTGRR
jgi:predicted RecA/RadA family phage recombinase